MGVLKAFFWWTWLRFTVPMRLAWRLRADVRLSDGTQLRIRSWTAAEYVELSRLVCPLIPTAHAAVLVSRSTLRRQRPVVARLSFEDLGHATRAVLDLNADSRVLGPIQKLIEASKRLDHAMGREGR
jgi:hypothetical protein